MCVSPTCTQVLSFSALTTRFLTSERAGLHSLPGHDRLRALAAPIPPLLCLWGQSVIRRAPQNLNSQPRVGITTQHLRILRSVFEERIIYVFILTDDIEPKASRSFIEWSSARLRSRAFNPLTRIFQSQRGSGCRTLTCVNTSHRRLTQETRVPVH